MVLKRTATARRKVSDSIGLADVIRSLIGKAPSPHARHKPDKGVPANTCRAEMRKKP